MVTTKTMMRTYPVQVWFNVIENNVEQVEMIGVKDKEEAFEVIDALLTNGITDVTLRDAYGTWSRYKRAGGDNE